MRYMWVTALPACDVLLVTLLAAWQKVFSPDVRIGFLAQAEKFSAALARNEVLAPAKNLQQVRQIIFNNYVDTAMALLFIAVVVTMLFCALRVIWQVYQHPAVTASESLVVWRAEHEWRDEAIWQE